MKYKVQFVTKSWQTVDVEAANEEEAKRKAQENFSTDYQDCGYDREEIVGICEES